MKQMIEILEQTPSTLRIQLKDPKSLDTEVFCLMENDQLCIPCLIENEVKGILMYSIDHYVPLTHFLNQYSFEKEEGYLFLKHLLEDAICSNRNKPVLLDPDFVFVSLYGDEFRFLVLPVHVQYWMYQKDVCRQWITYIQENIQTKSAYEIPGYLMKFLKYEDVTLANLVLGLEEMRNYYYPRRFLKKRLQKFRTREAVQIYGGYHQYHPVIESYSEGTQVLTSLPSEDAYLESDGKKLVLDADTVIIGRSKTCNLCLSFAEISSQHAKITCKDGKYYIQDLKSKNGTFLNEKKVQRKMRLKDGMKVIFGNRVYTFHENSI